MTGNQRPDRRTIRIGDVEREEAVSKLGEHFAAGRLTDDEHADRTASAYAARTRADLDGLFADLPGGEEGGSDRGDGPWGAQWGQQGAPPWAGRSAGDRRGGGPFGGGFAGSRALRWLPLPFVLLAVIGSVCAVAHGFFPFFVIPLLGIAAILFVLTRGAGTLRGQRV